tara:strand:+ start:927 stop:1223 length:297 start_codon:yes stop_codon:yes gene_type:complete
MSSIVEFEKSRWQDHQSSVTKFLNVLEKNKNDIQNTDLYVLKLIELNTLFDKIDSVIDEIKYECVYPNSKYSDHKKIKNEIKEHLEYKRIIREIIFKN